MWDVFYLGRHERTAARPGQIQPRQAQPEETAAAGAVPTATLPLAVLAAAVGWGQDDRVALQPLPGLPAGLTGTRCSPTRYPALTRLGGP
jgi:hypothetical protein